MAMGYIVHTDGGSRGNPGIAGAGAVISDDKGNVLKKVTEPLGEQTNNYAEYKAVILGLETLKKLVKKEERKGINVEIRLDSELVGRQLMGQYKIEEETLFPLFIKVWNTKVEHFPKLTFTNIPREENSEADALSNEAMDAQSTKNLDLGI